MTTKYKITSGFFLMVLLLGSVAFMGYRDIQEISVEFTVYSRLAKLNVATDRLKGSIHATAFEVYRFLDTQDPRYIENARQMVAEGIKLLENSKELSRRQESLTMIAELEKKLQPFQTLLSTLSVGVLNAEEQYTTLLLPQTVVLRNILEGMATQARESNNTQALLDISTVWPSIASVQSALGHFSASRKQEDANKVRSDLEKLSQTLNILEGHTQAPAGKKSFNDLLQAVTALKAAFVAMEAQHKATGTTLVHLESSLEELLKISDTFNAFVDDVMTAFERNMISDNAASQERTLLLSGFGLLTAVICAGFILYGLTQVLKEVGAFAAAVSRGNFTYAIRVREKGEIGDMITAMKQIPLVLDELGRDANALTNDILAGRFRNRLDSTHYAGSFAALTTTVNTISDAYTGVMDALPVPVMACDKKNNVLFLNKIAQEVIGGNLTNTNCEKQFKADACGTDQCFGARTMSQDALFSGETTIYPQGKRMNVAVTATPLHDTEGAVTGYMEIITDLTEIKTKQTTMMQVGSDANEIASRVAAASEELAAQIEEISRGADRQRSRVESTASAMMQMNSTVLEVARSAAQASEQSEGTRYKAENGAGLVNQVVLSINTVNTIATTLQDNMQELGKQAESIGGVLNVISDIADQTNLLALNAAIEAARAGDAGRGFAVVADEVRKLAEKTMSATQEVGSNITAIQNSARANINEVSNAVQSIYEATDLANSSGDALKEIVDLAAANSSIVASIATAAEEQSATSEEINRSIEEINTVVVETTDSMVQSSAAVHDLSQMAQELHRVLAVLK